MSRRRALPKILSQTESDALAATAQREIDAARTPTKRFAARRDLAMIATAAFAGLRNSELCKLQVTQIDLKGRQLRINDGKGGKDAYMPIGKKLGAVLADWIGDRNSGWLFPGPKGKRLSLRTFQLRLDVLAEAAGLVDVDELGNKSSRVHPHMLRHTFATSLLRAGSDIVNVSKLMRHSDVRTTLIYLHCDTTRYQGDVDRL